MFIRNHLDPGANQIYIGVTFGELALQPFPLFGAENVRVGARPLTKIAAIEQNDFNLAAGGTERVSAIHPSLFAPRTIGSSIQKIEQQPLALCFVRIVFPAIAEAII